MKSTISILLMTFLWSNSIVAQSGWFLLNSGTNANLLSITFPDVNTGYCVGGNGVFLRTTNAGLSWSAQTLAASYILRYIYFTNLSTGYIVSGNPSSGFDGKIYKTTDGGISWNMLTLPVNRSFYSIHFINSETGFATGLDVILKTTNGGINWTYQDFSAWGFITSICFVNSNTGYAAGYNSSSLIKTTDCGINWEYLYNYPGAGGYFGISFIDVNTGIAVGGHLSQTGMGFASRTTNGGGSWTNYNFNNTDNLWSIRFVNSTTGYIAGRQRTIMKTTNAGLNWNYQTWSADTNLTGNYFINANTGYVVGALGQILKTTDGGGSFIGIESNGGEVPADYALEQNYPNPFNPTTSIQFSIPKNSNVKLAVFDMLGRAVKTLVNEQLNPGTYQVEWNAVNYPSGTYFYRLTARDYTVTKKMLLVK